MSGFCHNANMFLDEKSPSHISIKIKMLSYGWFSKVYNALINFSSPTYFVLSLSVYIKIYFASQIYHHMRLAVKKLLFLAFHHFYTGQRGTKTLKWDILWEKEKTRITITVLPKGLVKLKPLHQHLRTIRFFLFSLRMMERSNGALESKFAPVKMTIKMTKIH